jgi:hypothetical protein
MRLYRKQAGLNLHPYLLLHRVTDSRSGPASSRPAAQRIHSPYLSGRPTAVLLDTSPSSHVFRVHEPLLVLDRPLCLRSLQRDLAGWRLTLATAQAVVARDFTNHSRHAQFHRGRCDIRRRIPNVHHSIYGHGSNHSPRRQDCC